MADDLLPGQIPAPITHMADGVRVCDCPHDFPVCAGDTIRGTALPQRSRWLSSLAGWPGAVTPEAAIAVVQETRRP